MQLKVSFWQEHWSKRAVYKCDVDSSISDPLASFEISLSVGLGLNIQLFSTRAQKKPNVFKKTLHDAESAGSAN